MHYREPIFEDGHDDETGTSGGRWVVEFPSGLKAVVPTVDPSADGEAYRLAEWIATYPG